MPSSFTRRPPARRVPPKVFPKTPNVFLRAARPIWPFVRNTALTMTAVTGVAFAGAVGYRATHSFLQPGASGELSDIAGSGLASLRLDEPSSPELQAAAAKVLSETFDRVLSGATTGDGIKRAVGREVSRVRGLLEDSRSPHTAAWYLQQTRLLLTLDETASGLVDFGSQTVPPEKLGEFQREQIRQTSADKLAAETLVPSGPEGEDSAELAQSCKDTLTSVLQFMHDTYMDDEIDARRETESGPSFG